MKYATDAQHFINKGMQAQLDLFGLFVKAKIMNIDVGLKLLESLVKSVIEYCSHIWGVSQIQKIKSFQMQFLRRLFRLPKYTQHWHLIPESLSKPIEISFLKNVSFFCTKIMARPKSSLTRLCFDYMRLSINKPKMKLNWFRDVSKLFEQYDCVELLDLDHTLQGNFTLSEASSSIVRKLDLVKNKCTENMIMRMKESKKMPFYHIRKTHCSIDEIMDSNTNWNLICF
jgi:hypothetical protein